MMFAQVVKFCCLCKYSDVINIAVVVNVIIICTLKKSSNSFVLLTRQNELLVKCKEF